MLIQISLYFYKSIQFLSQWPPKTYPLQFFRNEYFKTEKLSQFLLSESACHHHYLQTYINNPFCIVIIVSIIEVLTLGVFMQLS